VPKLKKIQPTNKGNITQELYMSLRQLYRNNLISEGPEEINSPRHRHLTKLMHSLTANQQVKLLQEDLQGYPELKAESYLYNPKTQTFKESK